MAADLRPGISHGIRGYTHNKCRCEVCDAAGAVWKAKRRKVKLPTRYLPVEPLLRFVDEEHRRAFGHVVKRCQAKGMSIYLADKWCIKLGVHPWVVYGDAFFADIWEMDNAD